MRNIISIIKAKVVGAFKLEITFSDDTKKIVDFKDFLVKTKLPDLKKYSKQQNFKKFKTISGNLVWGDYEMIFPLKDLYENQLVREKNITANKTA